MSGSTGPILLVEDNEDDAFFLQRALRKVDRDALLQIVTDGQQALDYFGGQLKFADRISYPIPSIILLDLKLPYLSGFEVLEHLRTRFNLAEIPVFILTSSAEERDRRRALDLGAAGYYVKPPTPEMLVEILKAASPQPEQDSI
jgi:CheY-like chemotaxis protein